MSGLNCIIAYSARALDHAHCSGLLRVPYAPHGYRERGYAAMEQIVVVARLPVILEHKTDGYINGYTDNINCYGWFIGNWLIKNIN